VGESQQSSNLISVANYLLDDVLGLDRTNKAVEVVASPVIKKADGDSYLRIEFKFSPGSWIRDVVELLPFDINLDKLTKNASYKFELQKEIKDHLDPQIDAFVKKQLEGVNGVERGVAVAAAGALEHLLASEILQPLSGYLAEAAVKFELPRRADIQAVFGGALDGAGTDYFRSFVPEVTKTFAKLGLGEILTIATTDSSPAWAEAIRHVGEGVLAPVIDNIVDNYFRDPDRSPVKVFDGVDFAKVFGETMAGFLIDFQVLDKKVIDDFLGLDGDNWVETQIGKLLTDQLNGFVQDTFVDAVRFLAGDFKASDVQALFDHFDGQFNIQELLGNLFTRYAGSELAQLFVEIDSLPEALVSQLGSWIASGAFGKALGSFAMDAVADIFGEVTANAIGISIFQGLGTILGAGIGAVAGSVVFELLDDLFDGAISGIFNTVIEWIRNDSPQAYYESVFDPGLNAFHWSGYSYSKDGSNQLRLAVKSTMEAFQNKVNAVIAFVGQPASFDTAYDEMFFVWGKKHYNESYASFIGHNESNKVSYNRSAERVASESIGAVLSHMNFHGGNPIIALAYDQWKAGLLSAGATSLGFFGPDAMVELQNLIGLAHFANDYRQDPTYFDLLMAGDTPIAVTLLQQYLEAESRGFNAATTLKGSVLGLATIGSAAAGDTIILDGPSWRAVARGGDDTIVIGAAAVQEIDGGTGDDLLVLPKDRSAYSARIVDGGGYGIVLTDLATGIRITAVDVERFRFNGATLSFDAAFPDGHLIPGTIGDDLITVRVAPPGQPTATVGNDTIYGADGNDRIEAGGGADFVLGDGGDDAIDGGAGDDRLYGWTGNDRITGGEDDDLLSGEAGDDWLQGGAGDDWIEGGPGSDTADYADARGAVSVSLALAGIAQDTLGAGRDTLVGIENLTGSAGDDTLRGDGAGNRLDGGAGADTLVGGPGDDIYVVDDPGDVVVEAAGQGTDTVVTFLGSRTDYARLYMLPGSVENLVGTAAGGQGVWGNGLDNVLTMGAGPDVIVLANAADYYADAGNDRVDGGGGNDFIFFGGGFTNADRADGGAGSDTLGLLGSYALRFDADDLASIEKLAVYSSGDAARPNVYALTMNDANVAAGATLTVTALSLQAGEHLVFDGSAETDGAFDLWGGRDTDVLTGGRGNDQLHGGLGADRLRGGGGNDLFDYRSAAESTPAAPDTILDFTPGDRIGLAAIDADGAAVNGDSAFTFIGGAPFHGTAGELRAWQDPSYSRAWHVEADVDGDGTADLAILVVTTSPSVTLGVSDFLL